MVFSAVGISKSFGDEILFKDISFNINKGDKVGLIGVNGAGKSTLFKILTNEVPCDSGETVLGKECRIGYMSKYLEADENVYVYNEALSVHKTLLQLERDIEDVNISIEIGDGDITELTNRQHRLNDEFERLDGFTYKSRTRSMLTGLGFSADDLEKKVKVLSGGERVRLQLAKLLLSGCDILLLDEPANHLDINAMQWLEDYLITFAGSIIVISHDRYFLDRVTTRTFEIENGHLMAFDGNYTTFMKKKEELNESRRNKYDNTMAEIKRIEGIIAQQKQWNRERNIKTAESKQKSVDRLRETLDRVEDAPESIRFEFHENKTSGNDVLLAENLKMDFDGETLFKNVSLNIKRGERIFLLGPNGCGKTTLFKLLLGQYDLPEGAGVKFGTNVETGYYDQSQSDLDDKKTVIDEIWDKYPKKTQTEIRNACAAFLFYGEDVFKDISVLSGGEKARVSLLKLMMSGSNFLMLDEPTNHLDIASREALEDSFEGYSGTMLIISHDRYFINKLADKIYYLTDDGIKVYGGNYEYYLEKIKEADRPQRSDGGSADDYRRKKELAGAFRKIQNNIKKCETDIERLELEINDLEQKISSDEAFADYAYLMEQSALLETAKNGLDEAMALWEKLNEELESDEYESLRK